MEIKYGDRVRESTQTEGTITYVLDGAGDALERTFIDGIGEGYYCYYCCEDDNNFEIGLGQLTAAANSASGFDELSRVQILSSSNSGDPVVWGVGTRTIFNTATAAALDHVAGFVINQSNVSFNRRKFVATDSQTNFDFIYIVGSCEAFVNGLLIPESDYTATDGLTVVFNSGLTAGDVVELKGIGQMSVNIVDGESNYDAIIIPEGSAVTEDSMIAMIIALG